jgi:hypothetical protein
MGEKKPWCAVDPEIATIRRGVMEEIERAGREPISPDTPDPVLADLFSGASVRELSAARDALACAQARAASTDPRRQQLLERPGVADGVSTEIVVEVDEHPSALCVPVEDAVGPLAQLVVRV